MGKGRLCYRGNLTECPYLFTLTYKETQQINLTYKRPKNFFLVGMSIIHHPNRNTFENEMKNY